MKELICFLLQLSGVPLLIREMFQRRLVTILVYHRVDPVTADRHFSALRRATHRSACRRISRRGGTTRSSGSRRKPLIVTIDDGHESVYRLKPVLAKHQMPVTVFLCSGFVGTNRRFWFSAPGLDPVQRQHLKTRAGRGAHGGAAGHRLRSLRRVWQRESLNVSEVRELRDLVDFQSHTVSHPILPACSDEKATEEIALSKRQLETQLDLRVNALAYPNGSYTARRWRSRGRPATSAASRQIRLQQSANASVRAKATDHPGRLRHQRVDRQKLRPVGLPSRGRTLGRESRFRRRRHPRWTPTISS